MTASAGRTAAARRTAAGRTPERLRVHYDVERELAARLKNSSSFEERQRLTAEVYDELYRRVPDHPMRGGEDLEARLRAVEWRLKQIAPYLRPDSVFLDVGAGDCRLAARVARRTRLAYALDIHFGEPLPDEPPNMKRVLSDGRSVDVPEGTVDVAFSDQVVEHVHPDDVIEHLKNVRRALRPGGVLFCCTPNRLYGPSDISGLFEDVATGLHLREYSVRDIQALLRDAGFGSVRPWVGARGWYLPAPAPVIAAVEAGFEAMPSRTRRRIASMAPLRALLGVRVAAFREGA